MFDAVKFHDFFQPESCTERLHIIGCGAIGSTLAENLVRLGLTKITLYDFDLVESKNIANQMYRETDIGKPKVQALAEMLCDINPDVRQSLKIAEKGYTGQKLSGYVFLCVDNIDLRRRIAETNRDNAFIRAMFDFRMRLTDAQHYAADWSQPNMVEDFLATMDFSHEEAQKETPVSACNITLSVAPTVRVIVACGVVNFVNFTQGKGVKKVVLIDAFKFDIVAL